MHCFRGLDKKNDHFKSPPCVCPHSCVRLQRVINNTKHDYLSKNFWPVLIDTLLYKLNILCCPPTFKTWHPNTTAR